MGRFTLYSGILARSIAWVVILFLQIDVSQSFAAKSSLEKYRPPEEISVPSVFKDMGVIQRKAMEKSGRILIQLGGGFDFSDAPYTMYGLNTDLGVGVGDFFEIWFHAIPFFMSSARPYVAQVTDDLVFADDQSPVKVVGKPKIEYGGYLLWAPFYGKDSIGTETIARSDTFMRVGASMINYEDAGSSGLKFSFGLGKSYFLSKSLGFRFVGNAAYIETPDIAKDGAVAPTSYKLFGFLELGFMVYL